MVFYIIFELNIYLSEILFGSSDTNQKTVAPPVLEGQVFFKGHRIDGFFLGQGEAMRDKVNMLNKVHEVEWVTSYLIKLYQKQFSSKINN